MKNLYWASLMGLLFISQPAAAATIVPSIPYNLTNGSVADATQVMGNFNTIVTDVNANGAHNGANSDITSLLGLTTPLSPTQGGTTLYQGGTSAGTANSQTLNSPLPIGFGLVVGNTVIFTASASNTGPMDLSVNLTSAEPVTKMNQSAAIPLTSGDIRNGGVYAVVWDGAGYQLLNPSSVVNGPATSTNGNIALMSGTTGQIIKDSGVALTSVVRTVTTQIFTSNGTYTPHAGMLYAIVEACGGGGGGGGVSVLANPAPAGGGGAGGYGRNTVTAATIGTSQSITIGAGGAGGANTGGTGTTGGQTSMGTIIVLEGGIGGSGNTVTATGVPGGLGGAVTTADLGVPGMPGGAAVVGLSSLPISGYGGNSIFGAGGLALYGQTSAPGNAGLGHCAGGSGAIGTLTAEAGGAGAPGEVVITEYNSQ